MAARHERDWGFFYWAAVGFLMSLGTLAILSIGFPFFVLGLLLLVIGLWRAPGWPADLGIPAGIGATCLLIAVIGPFAPTIWALVGSVLVVTGAGTFWWLRCRPRATSA